MFSYLLFGLSLAAAVAFAAVGLAMSVPPVTTDADAQDRVCCAYKGRDAACVPCRPTRETR